MQWNEGIFMLESPFIIYTSQVQKVEWIIMFWFQIRIENLITRVSFMIASKYNMISIFYNSNRNITAKLEVKC